MSAPPSALPRIALPPTTLFACALAFAYALPGLFGHDPWKPEDAIGAGIVYRMLAHGEWLLPSLAGEVYVDDGPFYYWVAAVFAKVFSFALTLDDGARIASGAAVVGTLLLLRDASRELFGRLQGEASMLVLLGCIGFMAHSHETLGELGMLFGQALALHAIALAPRKPWKGGVALGLGFAAAFLSKGLVALVAPLVTATALLALSPRWRTREYCASLLAAAVVFAVPLVAWGWAVHASIPGQGGLWFNAQWAALSPPSFSSTLYDLGVLAWSAFPAWPIALWVLWDRRDRLGEPGLLFAATATLAFGLVTLLSPERREVHTLPMLLPLALLAGPGVERLRRGAVNGLVWFGGVSFGFFAVLVWFAWFAMITGVPARFARRFTALEPGFVSQFQWFPFLVAVVFTLAWVYVLFRTDARSPYRSVLYWACGATLLWCLLMTLLLQWIDYGKTYRPISTSMASALGKAFPRGARCIESRGLGESQRAALDYHADIVTLRAELHGDTGCPVLLVQARPGDQDPSLGRAWKRIWEGNRPRDRERYRLYVRSP